MNIKDYMGIQQAADFMGVCKSTLRNWERDKKIQSYRNPANNWRLYKKEDLEAMLNKIVVSNNEL